MAKHALCHAAAEFMRIGYRRNRHGHLQPRCTERVIALSIYLEDHSLYSPRGVALSP